MARIHAATIDLVAEGGHGALSALAISRAAGVSRRTFYDHFADKDDCFLATYDLIVRALVRGVLEAQGEDPDLMERLRRGLRACAREIVERPRAARLALVEIYIDAPGAKERLRHYAGLLEALIERSFSQAPDRVDLPPQIYLAIVGAITAVARARLLAGAGEEFGEEAEQLAAWVLSLRDPAAGAAFAAPMPAARHVSAAGGDLGALPGCGSSPVESGTVLAVAGEIAAREGYAGVSAERIARELGLSRAEVRPQVPGREESMIAGLEEHGRRVIAEVRAAFSAQADWPEAVRAGVTALCVALDADRVLTRLALGEVFEAGPILTAWRSEKLGGLAALVRATAPPESRPTRLQAEASVAGVWALLAAAHQDEAGGQLRGMVGALTFIILAPVTGAPAAAAAVRQRPGRAGEQGKPADESGGRAQNVDGPTGKRAPVPGC